MQLVAKVSLFKSPFTICFISKDSVTLSDEERFKSIGLKVDKSHLSIGDKLENEDENFSSSTKKQLKLYATALFLQPFLRECLNSDIYRANVLDYLNKLSGTNNSTVILKLILKSPDKEVIDYVWNEKMLRLIWTKVEIENAFSWLSTLGGAYSALGEYFEHCADEAGKISIRQYKLSKLLGDDSLAARSRLYSALAYAQKGQLKQSRHIVRQIAAFARETQDIRLNRMCQGVWAKLKYLKQLKSSELSDEKLVSV